MKKMFRNITISILGMMLSACSSFFDKDNTPPPSPLVNFKAEAKIQPIWHTSTGSGVSDEYLKLVPAITQSVIYTASKDGTITATDKTTGKNIWRISVNASISAGPAANSGLVLVGTQNGNLIALYQKNGQIAWKTQTPSEILATPAIGVNIALAKSIDGTLSAYSLADGHPLWHYQQQNEPSIILRGSSAPKISLDTVYAGFANGTLSKLTLKEGRQIWQQTIAIPEGSYAVQRMVDIDADPILFGRKLYAATYQGRIAALSPTTGNESWSYDISSYSGIAVDENRVYVSDAKSNIWAFDTESGSVDWRQTRLESRNITGPAIMDKYIVVGDAEGYLHWLSKKDGHFVARIKVSSRGILATPVLDNNILYVYTMDGHLAAYTVVTS
jgi:outer membrane protein assembly factor BamB